MITQEEVDKARQLFNDGKLRICDFRRRYSLSKWKARQLIYNQSTAFFDPNYKPKKYVPRDNHKTEIFQLYEDGMKIAQIAELITDKYRTLLTPNACYMILKIAGKLKKIGV